MISHNLSYDLCIKIEVKYLKILWSCQAWQHWVNGTALDIVDPRLGDQWPKHEALECIQIGLLCTQEAAADRPSMSEIVLMLNSRTVTSPVPLHPPFLAASSDFVSSETKDATDKFDQHKKKHCNRP